MFVKSLSNFFTSSGIVVFPLTGLGVIYVTENKVKIDTIIQSIKDGTFSLDSLKALLSSESPKPEDTQQSNPGEGTGGDAAGSGDGSIIIGDDSETIIPNSNEPQQPPQPVEEKKETKTTPKKSKASSKEKKPKESLDLQTLIKKLIEEWESKKAAEKNTTTKQNLTKAIEAMKKIQTFVDGIANKKQE